MHIKYLFLLSPLLFTLMHAKPSQEYQQHTKQRMLMYEVESSACIAESTAKIKELSIDGTSKLLAMKDCVWQTVASKLNFSFISRILFGLRFEF